jgi:hypothetical protein
MARLWKGRGSTITLGAVLFLGIFPSPFAAAQSLYERPVLVVDPGMHTAVIRAAAVDTAGHFIATGSEDKTVWGRVRCLARPWRTPMRIARRGYSPNCSR